MILAEHTNTGYRNFALVVLTVVYGFNFIDRQIVGILAPFIKADLGINNTQMGLLIGFAFALFYSIVGLPIAYYADRLNRANIVALAVGVWSLFTALTGMAQNFTHIFLARMGVGIGEAGGSPPSHSIISDLYPKEKRAGALGIYGMGIPFGIMAAYFVTASLMGADPNTVDWRRIFITLGVTGIALAVFVKIVIREPVRGAQETKAGTAIERGDFKENLKMLLRIPSWWYMCLGIAFASFASYALSGFQTTFIRLLDPEFNFRTVVIWLGIINGIGYASGTYLGGMFADKWGKKDVRAYGWIPVLALCVGLPSGVIALWVTNVPAYLGVYGIRLIFVGMYLGPSFAIAQTLAPVHMRAMSTALFFFILNMIGLGAGPFIAGALIDVFGITGSDDLLATRYALSVICLGYLVGALFFLKAAGSLRQDWADAEARNERGAAKAE